MKKGKYFCFIIWKIQFYVVLYSNNTSNSSWSICWTTLITTSFSVFKASLSFNLLEVVNMSVKLLVSLIVFIYRLYAILPELLTCCFFKPKSSLSLNYKFRHWSLLFFHQYMYKNCICILYFPASEHMRCACTINLYMRGTVSCVSFSFTRFTPTHHACLIGSSEIVIALIELECDVNAKDKKGNNYIKILMF